MMNNYWDIHNHILPGVDDGSSCLEETMLLIEEEYNQGVRNIIFTPHYRPNMFEVSCEDRQEVFEEILPEIAEKYPDLNCYLGCELYLSENSIENATKLGNRMNSTPIVLVEFNYGVAFATP